MEFPSDFVYLAHKKGNHKTQLEKGVPIEPPPIPTPPLGVSPEALPTQEFIEQVKRIEDAKEEATGDSTPSQHPPEMPPAQPVVLTYKFTGECSEHRQPVDTLELDVAEKHFAIAICPTCKKQLVTREVAKL